MTGAERRSLIPFSGLLSALFAGISLIIAVWLLARSGSFLTEPVRPAPGAGDSAVLMITSSNQMSGQFSLFRAGLTAAGLTSDIWTLPEQPSTDELQAAVAKLATAAHCPASRIWLAVSGESAGRIWQAACATNEMAGMLLFVPQDLDRLTTGQIQQWHKERPLAIFASESSDRTVRQETAFYEILTGEDATLFPGYQSGSSQPVEYTSVDGRTWLGFYPMLASNWAMTSPRILPDALIWLADWSGNDQTAGSYRLAARLMTDMPFQLLLAGLLILIGLVSLNLFLYAEAARLSDYTEQTAQPTAINRMTLTGMLIWLPSLIISGAIGWLANRLTNGQADALYLCLGILPGVNGWLWLLIAQFRRSGSSPAATVRLPRQSLKWLGLFVPALFLILAGFWSGLALGTAFTSLRNWALLVMFAIIGWPAGYADRRCPTDGRSFEACWPNGGIIQLIRQHLPFLLLPIPAFLLAGWSGLATGTLIIVVRFWSTGLGKATAIVCRNRQAGNTAQSVAYALGMLMPPLISGFSKLLA